MRFDNIIEKFLNTFFPRRCKLCGKLLDESGEICSLCEKEIIRIEEPHCVVCGLKSNCCKCESFDTIFDRRRAPFVYAGPIREGIHRMKFQNKPFISRYFAGEMAEYVRKEYSEFRIDLVVCVPMTYIDTVKRGYNQAALLASQIADQLGFDCDTTALKKVRATKKQHELDAAERAHNLKDVFAASSHADIAGKTILLCDDVATTGHTLNECARALLDAGAKQVLCISVAAVC